MYISQSTSSQDYGKCIDLSKLSFKNRSSEEQQQALIRHNVPKESFVTQLFGHPNNPFMDDIRAITGDSLYRRTSRLGQLAPSNSPSFQNRITHIQHVSQIAEKLALRMNLDSHSAKLAQAIALAHDIGHAPFSHEGEHVFKEKLKEMGGDWDHDIYTIELLTEMAHGGLRFNGLPITNATLEGVVKRYKRYHDTPQQTTNHFNRPLSELPPYIQKLEKETGCLKLDKWNCIEGQIASIADWVAFTVTDTRDMLYMYLYELPPREFTQKKNHLLSQLPIAKQAWDKIAQEATEILQHNPQRSLLGKQNFNKKMQTIILLFSYALEEELIADILQQTQECFTKNQHRINHAEDIRNLDTLMVQFSNEVSKQLNDYAKFFQENVFNKLLKEHIDTIKCMSKFFDMVEEKFENPEVDYSIPIAESWQDYYKTLNHIPNDSDKKLAKKTLVAKYIATNFTDYDVLYFLQKDALDFYNAQTANIKSGPYPQYAIWNDVDRIITQYNKSNQPCMHR